MKYIIIINDEKYLVNVQKENCTKGEAQKSAEPINFVKPIIDDVKPEAVLEKKNLNLSTRSTVNSGEMTVDAPIPGTVLEVKITVGQNVKAGDNLIVIEAMKMENDIVAPADGQVSSILVSQGDYVDSGKTLVTLK